MVGWYYMKKAFSLFISLFLLINHTTIFSQALNKDGDLILAQNSYVNIYVSPSGSDDNDGSFNHPFKTISKAKRFAASLNDGTYDINVYLRGGTYFLDETITFTAQDGGKGGKTIRYLAYHNEKPIISGGKRITGWSLHDSEKNIYKAENVNFNFRQLYINDTKALRALQVPSNNKYSQRIIKAYREETTVDGYTYPAKSITMDKSLTSNWNNLQDVEIKVLTAWTENIMRISSITTIGNRSVILVQEPEATRVFNRPHPDINGYSHENTTAFVFYFENAYEFIDEDNEWYLDRKTNTLYFKAPMGFDMNSADVIAPKVETLISIEGTLDEPVKNLEFHGITFAHSNWTRPSEEGAIGGQASQYVLTSSLDNVIGVYRPPAAVYVKCAENIIFERNKFHFLGSTGLDFHYGTSNCSIIGNVFSEISGNGINVGKFVRDDLIDYHDVYNPSDMREVCTNCLISNNYLTKIGTDYDGSVGIAAGYPRQITITHNTLSHMPYTGISVGYGWTNKDNPMNGNVISYNHIHHVNEVVCDGAAIYTLSKQPNSEISKNYIHDIYRKEWHDYGCAGIYLDEQTSGYTVFDNVMINTPSIWQNRTGTNNLYNNGAMNTQVILNAGVISQYQDILPEDEKEKYIYAPSGGWTAIAYSTYGSNLPAYAFDDSSDTRWVSGQDQEEGSFFMVDMKSIRNIKGVKFTGSKNVNDDFPSDCIISLSENGIDWSDPVAVISDNQDVTIDVKFETQRARYISIVITKAKSAWWDIRSFYVYEELDDSRWYSTADFSTHNLYFGNISPVTMEFLVTPLKNNIDGYIGYTSKENNISGWSTCAIVVRLNVDGYFDCRSGNAYVGNPIPYEAGITYKVKIVADLDSKLYTVTIDDKILYQNAAFRSDSAPISNIGKICVRGGHQIPAGEFYIENHNYRIEGGYITLQNLFDENMVLQRGKPHRIFGKATPNSNITVTLSNGEISSSKTVISDNNEFFMAELDPLPSSPLPYTLNVTDGKNTKTINNVFIGDVFVLAGQSNMEQNYYKFHEQLGSGITAKDEPERISNEMIKHFTISQTTSQTETFNVTYKYGSWKPLNESNNKELSYIGQYFADEISKLNPDVPIGIMSVACGGTQIDSWMRKSDENKTLNYTPSSGNIYNNHIAPLINYKIAGILWYQGENDYQNPKMYEEAFPQLINDYRKLWGEDDLPFFYAQLSRYTGRDYTQIRESQRKTLEKVKNKNNVAMVVTIDTDKGTYQNIHPLGKPEIGKRFAQAAKNIIYKEDVVYHGPLFKEAKINGNEIIIYFKESSIGDGLIIKNPYGANDTTLSEFEIAGETGKFVPADAYITEDNTVVVSSKDVPNPKYVRYAASSVPKNPNLYNKNGLPASPFTSDDRYVSSSEFNTIKIDESTNSTMIAEFKVTAFSDKIDGIIGHTGSENSVSSWNSCGVLIRLYTNGYFEYYNGSSYVTSKIPYKKDEVYTVKLYINTDKKKYSAYIKPENSNDFLVLCENASLRSDAPKMNNIGKLLVRGGQNRASGEFAIFDYKIRQLLPLEILYKDNSKCTIYSDSSKMATVIFAKYNDLKLENVNTKEITFKENDITIVNTSHEYDKLFIWNDLKSMVPLI